MEFLLRVYGRRGGHDFWKGDRSFFRSVLPAAADDRKQDDVSDYNSNYVLSLVYWGRSLFWPASGKIIVVNGRWPLLMISSPSSKLLVSGVWWWALQRGQKVERAVGLGVDVRLGGQDKKSGGRPH